MGGVLLENGAEAKIVTGIDDHSCFCVAAGEDDLRIDPAAVARLEEQGHYTMMVEGEDEPEDGQGWPVIPGDRVVFSAFEQEDLSQID